MGSLSEKFSINSLRLRDIKKTLNKVNSYQDMMAKLTDNDLQAKTQEFKDRIAKGETLDDLLPEAFAAVREADRRILGMFPYDVQVMGAIALHQGFIAEMRTGEGKTLTATMPLYLNALTGKGVMLVTTNSYLSRRDGTEMGDVYRWMGLTVALGVPEDPLEKFSVPEKRAIYASDIVYTTHSTLGFDYLIQNLADSAAKQFLREFNYAIVDEVDEVLLDSAQTPLIISGSPRVQSNYYNVANTFITTLEEVRDYKFDDERANVWLTNKGISEAEKFFGIENLFDANHTEIVRHIILALKAHHLYEREEGYIVENDEIILLDAISGRSLEGTKLQAGQHQAIETKEAVDRTPETRAMASVTYQNLFKLFEKLSGMTGTGRVADDEFIETYDMPVITIPTNRPNQRIDHKDLIYTSLPEKIIASMEFLKKVHATGQPILLVTATVEMSEIYSHLLLKEGIAHSVLNAYNTAKEAEMIAEAGQKGNVTVVTAIAGRGTDIKLGKGVADLGGLAVIGTERMPSKRIDLQMRGRSGRQGDPGMSQFFASLEDALLIKWGPAWLLDYLRKQLPKMDPNKPKLLKSNRYQRILNQAQEASDSHGRQARQNSVEMDESIQVQREMIYSLRNQLIEQEKLEDVNLLEILDEVLTNFLSQEKEMTEEKLSRYVFDNLSYQFDDQEIDYNSQDSMREALRRIFLKEMEDKEVQFGDKQDYINFQRMAILKAIDQAWIEQVDYLQQFRILVASRNSAQRNTTYEFHREALLTFQELELRVKQSIIRNLALSMLAYNPKGELVAYFA
ncbi:accessory Sec system translocase SecA2 [Streptococcus uberis]|uniref:accessory Sec system translocase SecA2 n=1 Tax=Streptococcus uberis TaxID=1349 RepID=UPI0027DDAB5D|nr:accessory Sec system translocase SecA2 [Streptococcus uberis]MCK1239322.1 accessory Sec system translocase SecA2 [Streptococcus uberis]